MTLAQGDIAEVLVLDSEAKLPAKILHILQWIYSLAKYKEHRSAQTCLLVGLIK